MKLDERAHQLACESFDDLVGLPNIPAVVQMFEAKLRKHQKEVIEACVKFVAASDPHKPHDVVAENLRDIMPDLDHVFE